MLKKQERSVKNIVLASKNPVKAQAALEGFQRMFPDELFKIHPVSVPSGVDDQPFSDAETLQGAWTRLENARREVPQADYWVGIEGGVEEVAGELFAFAWVVVRSATLQGKGRTGTFVLPQRVAELVHSGLELGAADDIVFERTNSKQENGAVGLLTGDVVDRAGFYEHAVVLALIPFKNAGLYGS
jgi:inosine/xanthosine triphosphatase